MSQVCGQTGIARCVEEHLVDPGWSELLLTRAHLVFLEQLDRPVVRALDIIREEACRKLSAGPMVVQALAACVFSRA